MDPLTSHSSTSARGRTRRVRRAELHDIAAGAEALGDRASKIDARAAPSNPPPCPAFTRIPDEARQGRARLGDFVAS